MLKQLKTAIATVKNFHRSEGGSATVEHILWIPLLGGFVMLATDATLLMHQQTYLYELSRDAARMVSVGEKTIEEAEIATKARLAGNSDYVVSVSISDEYVVSKVTVPFNKVVLFNGPFVGSAKLEGGVTMWMEGTGGA